ncbi:YceI family protein [Chryseobacterium manosquense]|uniref:YceI family protein n=2 Tax=Chryseobacterium group TaxID=2782232 RepID=A0A246B8K8_9FLAO|nr:MULTISPECIES: YceI family protein [Chryseobacterium group]OWK97778.1 YceI family protein [Kaistella haifensis DSM 19056]QNS41150.1 YceI family protein [Chryseobacterium manosquense]
MKNTLKSVMLLFAVTFFGFVNAQNITGKSTKIAVDGTSPMHDWTMTSSSANFSGTINGNAITNVKFNMPVKNLKSTKGKMMDNKAYDALKADKAPNISFTATSLSVGKGNLAGKLTIAGVTKDVSFPVNVVKNGASYNITGTENLKLSDFGMERPGFMGIKNR